MNLNEIEEFFYDDYDEDFNGYMATPKGEMHRRICQDLNVSYKDKNSDYGDSYARFREKYPDAVLMRLFDKYCRLEQLLSGKDRKVKDETIEDTLLDMANYCIMEVVERKYGKR